MDRRLVERIEGSKLINSEIITSSCLLDL